MVGGGSAEGGAMHRVDTAEAIAQRREISGLMRAMKAPLEADRHHVKIELLHYPLVGRTK
jgi:hypothetical protein